MGGKKQVMIGGVYELKEGDFLKLGDIKLYLFVDGYDLRERKVEVVGDGRDNNQREEFECVEGMGIIMFYEVEGRI